MARKISRGDRIRYKFDLLLSHGSASTIGWVVALAAVLTVVGGLAFWVIGVGVGRPGPIESAWQAFLTVIGRGSIADAGWVDRLASLTLVLAGVFLTGSLIAVLVAAVTKRIDALRRGQGRVHEQNHAVILGWSPRLMPVIDELLAGDHGARRVTVVVLADRDKQDMEDDFRGRYRGAVRKQVLFRRGDPSKTSDLEMVAVDQAGSVIVLSEGSFVDAIAVQRALAAHASAPKTIKVVAEMTNPRVARSLTSSTSNGVVTVTVNRVVADMLAQAIRTQGMAVVFDQLLSFKGSELYVCKPGAAADRRFAEVACGADGLVVLGVLTADGKVCIPHPGSVISSHDRLVVLAESQPDEVPTLDQIADPIASPPANPTPLSVVMVGWSHVGAFTMDRLAEYLPAGSRVEVLADTSLSPEGAPPWTWSLDGAFVHTKHEPEDILGTIVRAGADVVAVLGYSDGMSEPEADALTLLTLLMLDQPQNRERIRGVRIVAHLFDSRLHSLAMAGGADDFVVTDALASRMLVHAARHPSMGDVYADLFDPDGPIIDVIPAPPTRTSYGQAAAGVVLEGFVPIGMIVGGQVILNPSRSRVISFGDADRIVVVRAADGDRGTSSAPTVEAERDQVS